MTPSAEGLAPSSVAINSFVAVRMTVAVVPFFISSDSLTDGGTTTPTGSSHPSHVSNRMRCGQAGRGDAMLRHHNLLGEGQS